MIDVPPWVAALNISSEDYLEWLQIFPAQAFILSWAIESKRVDEEAYLKWATSFYKLPVLKANFFLQPPPLEMWKKYLGGPWSPTVLPLYEWKGTIFVGVLEPKNFILDNVKVQLVLAPSTAQNPWWHHFTQLRKTMLSEPPTSQSADLPPPLPPLANSPVAVAPPSPKIVPPAAPSVPSPTKPLAMPQMPIVVSEKLESIPAVEIETVTVSTIRPAPGEDAPSVAAKKAAIVETIDRPVTPLGLAEPKEVQEGPLEEIKEIVSANPVEELLPVIATPPPPPLKPPPPNISAFLKPEKKPEKKIDLKTAEDLMPQGFNLKMDPVVIEPHPPITTHFEDAIPNGLAVEKELIQNKPQMEGVVAVGLDVNEIPQVDVNQMENLAISEEVVVEEEKSVPLSPFAQAPAPASPPVVAAKPVVPPPITTPVPASVAVAAPAPTTAPAPTAAPSAPPPPPMVDNTPLGVPDGSVKMILQRMRSHFEKGMVLLKQDGNLRPYQWDQTWTLETRDKLDVDLQHPSLFKIVIDTRHPFHGSARPSESNDKFFKIWNKNKYPDHVTALPLKAEGEVFGILLGITNYQKGTGINLTDYEKIADQLAHALALNVSAA